MRRTKTLRSVFMILLLLLCGRLCYVQVLCSDELTAAAQCQQMIPVLREDRKGVIYDRNMIPLTGTDRVYYYMIHKDNLTEGAENLLSRMNADGAGWKGEDYLVYRTGRYFPQIVSSLQKQYKAYGFAADVRCERQQTAASLVQDLDEMYAKLLQKDDPVFCFLGNAAGGLIHGTGIASETLSGVGSGGSLITAIDGSLQEKLEKLFEETDAAGSIVVTDTRTGQVLVMVSRDPEGTETNLPVECAYPIGKIYELIKKTGGILEMKPADAAGLLGFGNLVFEGYPGEAAGTLNGKKTTVSAAQMSRALAIIANQGEDVPLTLVLRVMREESVPCIELTGAAAEKLAKLQQELEKAPLTGSGWSIGYSENYAIVIRLEKGNEESIYKLMKENL